jgi:hypothetical protein
VALQSKLAVPQFGVSDISITPCGKLSPSLLINAADEAGPESRRAYIERNSIALLSNYNKVALDAPSLEWLARISHPT